MTSVSERTFPLCEESFSGSSPFVSDNFMDFSLFMDVEVPPATNDFVDGESEILTKPNDGERMRNEEDSSADFNLPIKKRSKTNFDSKTKESDSYYSSPSGNKKRIRKVLYDSGSDIKFQNSDVTEPCDSINSYNTTVFCPGQSADHRTSTVPWRKHASLPVNSKLVPVAPVFGINKCHSEAQLRSATNGFKCEDSNLIGDFSRPFLLPIVSGKHPDLKAISHETMADVLHDRYPDVKENCTVVDCRYPYEFEAGHVVGARNIYSKDEIFKEFLQSRPSTAPLKHPILIFHCEFSSERGPKLLRFLRNLDRDAHGENYPKLFYPEMYILEGGYKEFCEWHKDLCNPDGYKPMLHKDHAAELSFYRSQSKLYSTKDLHFVDRNAHSGKRNHWKCKTLSYASSAVQ